MVRANILAVKTLWRFNRLAAETVWDMNKGFDRGLLERIERRISDEILTPMYNTRHEP